MDLCDEIRHAYYARGAAINELKKLDHHLLAETRMIKKRQWMSEKFLTSSSQCCIRAARSLSTKRHNALHVTRLLLTAYAEVTNIPP